MKKFIVACVRAALWYEASFYSDRLAFAGGVLAGTLITFVCGLVGLGYGFTQSLTAVVFAVVIFFVILFCASGIFCIGKKYGDREPLDKILNELDDEKKIDNK